MELGLSNAAVFVNGGTKGLGKESALAFAREGARVAVSGRGRDAIDQTVTQLRLAGAADAVGIAMDLQDLPSIEAGFAAIEARWGELNTLINMAGPNVPSEGRDLTEVPDAQWQYYFDVGIMSVVRCTRLALPLMRKATWARVINISSVSSVLGLSFEAPYMTAKAALNALSKNMAFALAKEGILVNTVTPGIFRTEGTSVFMDMQGVTDRYSPDDLGSILAWAREINGARCGGVVGRVGLPSELAPLLLLLGSRVNTYIVGANIPVDGGTDF
jgi:NAD(P)-dependent dehydrogenase (short-subunit alcohol dehydrogenase family)